MYLPLRKLPTILLLDGPFLTEWDKNGHREFSSDMSKRGSVLARAITNAPSATETIHSRLVVNHNSLSCNVQLYTLGHSPICVNEVEKSLKNYPYKVN